MGPNSSKIGLMSASFINRGIWPMNNFRAFTPPTGAVGVAVTETEVVAPSPPRRSCDEDVVDEESVE